MASGLHFIELLCLISGLWIGANAYCVIDRNNCKACPDGWTKFHCYCYLYHHGEKDWTDAEHTCIDLGGNLASIPITFLGSYSFIKSMIKRATNEDRPVWIGGHDSTKEGVWLWSDGSKFGFNRWLYNQPNNTNGEEHCMEINYNYAVNDANCLEKRSFVCGMKLF